MIVTLIVVTTIVLISIIGAVLNLVLPPENSNSNIKTYEHKSSIDYDLVHTLNYYQSRKFKDPKQ